MIVDIYIRSKADPTLLQHTDTRKVYTLEDLNKIEADYTTLAPENDNDLQIMKELEKQGLLADETSMHPKVD